MLENDKIKISTLVIGAVIFMAYINQYAYYLVFHVDISNYIEISEVLTPFIDDLTAIIICYAVATLLVKNWINRIESKEPKKHKSKFRFVNLIYNKPIEILVSINLLYMGYVYIFYANNFLKYFILIYVGIYVVIQLYTINNIEIEKYKVSNSISYFTISTIIIMFYTHCAYTAWKSQNVHTNYKKIEYKFILIDGDTIQTDINKAYIGRTTNKFFIYNKPEDRTDIYNTSDIKKEEVMKID